MPNKQLPRDCDRQRFTEGEPHVSHPVVGTDKMQRVDRNRVAPFPASPDGWTGFVATAFNLTSFQQIRKAPHFFVYWGLDKTYGMATPGGPAGKLGSWRQPCKRPTTPTTGESTIWQTVDLPRNSGTCRNDRLGGHRRWRIEAPAGVRRSTSPTRAR